MTDLEAYQFDLAGHLHIRAMLSADQAAALHEACIALEADALACREHAPHWTAIWNDMDYWQSEAHGYFAFGERAEGKTLMVEDFWLWPDVFDALIGHERTTQYINRIVPQPAVINNSELRIRYRDNQSRMHMGLPRSRMAKYRYEVVDGQIVCNMVRMVYFLHDVNLEQGPMCFVPGSHQNALPCPVAHERVEDEPCMVGVAVKAGDALLFTEACRHGGLSNRSDQTRYTLHVGYGPDYLKSQNIGTMDEEPNVTNALLSRITSQQRNLLVRQRKQPKK